jgi:hypothetical protein
MKGWLMVEPAGLGSAASLRGWLQMAVDYASSLPAKRRASGCRSCAASELPQHPPACWTGGHLTDPYEQKTQQSPGLGRSSVLQELHS